MSFFSEDFAKGSDSSYTKLEDGDNVVRILGNPIEGWQGWVDEGGKKSPERFKLTEKPLDVSKYNDTGGLKKFSSFIIWNYSVKAVEIMTLTQSSIVKEIQALSLDEDWGSPLQYDIKINRKGSGLETSYTVSPKPAKKLTSAIADEFAKKPITLEKLFTGENPFDEVVQDMATEPEPDINAEDLPV